MTFWQKAAQSLPPQVRARYADDFAAAERWDAAFEGLKSAVKSGRISRERRGNQDSAGKEC